MFDTIVFFRGEFLHYGDMMTKEKWIFFLNVTYLNAKNLEILASHQTQW
jgi:hypothetical protein